MKICPLCQQSYTDDELNFCLNDGTVLRSSYDDAPPTVFMPAPRVTDRMSGQNTAPFGSWQNQSSPPLQQQQQPTSAQQNRGFADGIFPPAQNQTLPTVSLVLSVLSLVLICCHGGIPFGVAALVTGYLGIVNTNKNPSEYGGRGMAIAGIILGALGFFSGIFVALAVLFAK